MLTFFGRKQDYCDGVSRRDFLRVGALTVGGLSLADVLRMQTQGATVSPNAAGPTARSSGRGKSVIMIVLPGGPTHLDTYDMKPQAAREFRGELSPINTNVPGLQICELMPRQAQIMDKLAILRGVTFVEEHSAVEMMSGFPDSAHRPCFGSMVSFLQNRRNGLPPYVSMTNLRAKNEAPEYCGAAHRPFVTSGPGLDNLQLVSGVSLDRLDDRKHLLQNLDHLRREVDYRSAMTGIDPFTVRALDMIASADARMAFDVEKEPPSVQERYGRENRDFLRARRLVEAGVSVVTLATGSWDTHVGNFKSMRQQLPRLDQAIYALVTDLAERGLDKDVALVMWGEFGRTPRVNGDAGRDHWGPAGIALMAGGGFKMGQAIGQSDARGERPLGRRITPSNALATLYRHMGIDTQTTLPDHNGRPMYILEDREPIRELI